MEEKVKLPSHVILDPLLQKRGRERGRKDELCLSEKREDGMSALLSSVGHKGNSRGCGDMEGKESDTQEAGDV